MAVTDLWVGADKKTPTQRYGRGLRYRVTVPGHPSKAFRTKKEAENHELKLKTTRPAVARSDATVGPLIDLWLEGKGGLSKGGRDAAKAGAGHARERWAEELVVDVRSHQVQAWIANMTIARRVGDVQLRVPASQASKSKALSALRGALAIAMSLGYVEVNEAAGAKPGRTAVRPATFLTLAQVAKLADECAPYEPMLWLLATTGVRLGECCALNVGSVARHKGKWRLGVTKTKNLKPRSVPIPASVVAMLSLDRGKAEPLFVTPRGRRVQKDNWRARVFDPAKDRAKLDLVPHDLRHTAASLMIRSGATTKDVQNVLGHASAKMTLDLYAGWWDDAIDDVADRMDAALIPVLTHSVPDPV